MFLIIALPHQPHFSASETSAGWSLFDARGGWLRSGTDVLSAMPRAEQVIATVPASRIVFIETPLPRISGARREALLRYAIEDKLTIDPDTVHVALLGEADSDESADESTKISATRYIVAAIDRRYFSEALAWLSAAGLAPRAVFAETESVVVAMGEWAIVLGPQQSYAKRHDGFAYALDSGASTALAEPPFALSLALREVAKPPTSLVVYVTGHDESHPPSVDLAAQWQIKLGIPTRIAVNTAPAQSGNRLLQLKAGNLLTGEFKPRSAGSSWLKNLRPVLWLMVVLLGLQLLFNIADWWRLDRQRLLIEAEMRQLFQTTFPNATAIVDPALQLQRNLDTLKRERGLSQRGDPRLTLAQLTELTQSVPELVIGEINIGETATTLSGSLANPTSEAALREKISLMPHASFNFEIPKPGNPARVVITIKPKAGT